MNQKSKNETADSTASPVDRTKGIQLAGLLLWRFGLLLAGATALYRTTSFLLQFFELPTQLEIGTGLAFAGAVLFMVSLIMERVVDAHMEGDLRK